ncbi:serine hydrolase [Leuconostocaceae bacterium ESL0723]|nr:serine hydrolase [Leuconostocaceae bacterium ESL0723]
MTGKRQQPQESPSRVSLFATKRQRPFWQSWWFWLLIVASLIIVAAFFYVRHTQPKPSQPKRNGQPVALKTTARHAIVVDAQTGQILGTKDSQTQVGVASQSKMLTSYGVLQAIKAGKIKWTDKVPITSKNDWSDKDKDTFAHLDIHAGQKIAVAELFGAMYTSSANDAAFALLDYVKPRNQSAQQTLEKWAAELHLDGSRWYNAAGQVNKDAFAYEVKDAKPDAENTASAEQLAILARTNLQLDPNIRDYYEKLGFVYHPEPDVNKISQTEYSKLKQEVMPKLHNPKDLIFEGLKTGSTPESGGAFTGLIKDQAGHEFITVVSGAGRYTTQVPRYQDTLDIVNQVLDEQQPLTFQAGQKITSLSKITAPNLKGGAVAPVVGKTITFWVPKVSRLTPGQLGWQRPRQVSLTHLSAGQTVLSVSPNLSAQYLSHSKVGEHQLDLVAPKQQGEANFFQRVWQWLTKW